MSFVDCLGHDILMATMLNGAAVMDAALLLIAGLCRFIAGAVITVKRGFCTIQCVAAAVCVYNKCHDMAGLLLIHMFSSKIKIRLSFYQANEFNTCISYNIYHN